MADWMRIFMFSLQRVTLGPSAAIGITLFLALVSPPVACNSDWLQFGHDAQHSGTNLDEKDYSTAGNKLLYATNAGNTEPIYLSNVVTSTGTKDLLFSVTSNGSVIALDAATGTVVWQVALPGTAQRMRATPAVDPNRQFLYALGMDGKAHKLLVGNGAEVSDLNWPETVSIKPDIEQFSSALTIAQDSAGNTHLVATTGSYGDGGDYQGHVTSIDLSSGGQNTFNVLCSNLSIHFVENGTPGVTDCNYAVFTQGNNFGMAGVWAAGGAAYDSSTDRIYFATGNGQFDANTGGYNWGDTLLSLKADATGSGMGWPFDSYTPSDFGTLYAQDIDLGITTPIILPSTSTSYPHLAFQVGKDKCGRLINLDNMSGAGGPGHVGGEINTSCYTFTDNGFHPVIVWVDRSDGSTRVYSDIEERLTFGQSGSPALEPAWTNQFVQDLSMSVYANETLYGFAQPNGIYALSAVDGSTLWSYMVPGSDISAIEFVAPIVANGRLFVPVFYGGTSQILAFELDGVFKDGYD